ncbi:MAG: alpha/beta fold hydrolase [Candidatus Gastranaerophilales bacterium]|nr:alpha/beta fold hydrolase [Candidatus Gastranaerophilales bacterium]
MMTKNCEELYLKTSDGVKLAVNHFKTGQQQVIIIANGWTMSKDSIFVKEMSNSLAKSFDVISFDFRGHGKSSGVYTFTGKESEDLKSVVNYAKKLYKKVYLIGFSLGGAISILYTAIERGIDRLIVVSAPHSFGKIKHFMWVKDFLENPFKKYEFRVCRTLRPSPIVQKKIKPIDVVDRICVPTLFIAGDLDTIIHSDDTESLFHKATCEKKFELFQNCNHGEDLIYQEKEKLVNTCVKWFCEEKN